VEESYPSPVQDELAVVFFVVEKTESTFQNSLNLGGGRFRLLLRMSLREIVDETNNRGATEKGNPLD